MAKIQEVNYKDIPGKVGKMRTAALEINNEIVTSYSKINAMKSNWHGIRYNELASECNKIIPDLDKLLKLIVTEIPHALELVANNYSKADSGAKITSEQQTPAKKVPEVATSTETTMKFLTTEVTSVKEEVGRSFTKSLNQLDEFQRIFNSINWSSEAADVFKREFTASKNKINTALSNIQKLFTTLMKQAAEDVQAAESNNTL